MFATTASLIFALSLAPQIPGKNAVSEARDYLHRLSGFGYSGALLVAIDGRIVLREAYGFANKASHVRNRPDTLFDVGSLAKFFTAAAILRLEMDGKLVVEEPIDRFFPSLPADKKGITVRELLTHTSGIQFDEPLSAEVSKQESVRHILETTLAFPPGSQWKYSNAGYVLLAAIVETAGGLPYRAYVRHNIFERAGMSSTGFWGADLPRVNPVRIARGYDELGEVGNPARWSSTTWNDLGGGQVVSTVDDLYKWKQALDSFKVISREETAKMMTPCMPEKAVFGSWSTSNYGYGVFVQKMQDGTSRIQHGGDYLGFGSLWNWYPEHSTFIAALCNVRHDLYPSRIRADRVVPKILFGEKYDSVPSFVALSSRDLERFVGTYETAVGDRITISRCEQGLSVGADGQAATLALDGAPRAEGEDLAKENSRTTLIVSDLLRGQDASLVAAGGDPSFCEAVRGELKELGGGKGRFLNARAIGTYRGGFPLHVQDTVIELVYAGGIAYYKIQWEGGTIIGTDLRSPHLSGITMLQPQSVHRLVGWSFTTANQVFLDFVGSTVTVTSGNSSLTARRV